MTEEKAANILDDEIFAVSQVKFAKQGSTKEPDSASGFFFKQDSQLFFTTNRHVVIDENDWFYPDELILKLHTNEKDLTENEVFRKHPDMGNDIELWLYR